MRALTIRDREPKRNVLGFDLRDILVVVGDDVVRSTWTVRYVESVGGESDALHDASDREAPIDGRRLIEIAQTVVQIMDGDFSAYLSGAHEPWIVIRAVDSTCWDVYTDRADILARLRERFTDVEDITES